MRIFHLAVAVPLLLASCYLGLEGCAPINQRPMPLDNNYPQTPQQQGPGYAQPTYSGQSYPAPQQPGIGTWYPPPGSYPAPKGSPNDHIINLPSTGEQHKTRAVNHPAKGEE